MLSSNAAFLIVFALCPAALFSQAASPSISGPSDGVKSAPYTVTVDGRLPILVSGYVQLRYTDQNGTANPFQVKRLRFIADAQLTPNLDVFAQVDLTLSPNLLLDGYIQYKRFRAATIRAGQFKVAFSGESLVSDERTVAIERSLVVNGFSPGRDSGQQGRALGVELLGSAGSETGPSLEYQAGFLNGGSINNVQSKGENAAAGRVLIHPVRGVSFGSDYYQGKQPVSGAQANGSASLTKQRQDLEAGLIRGRFTSWGEYLWGRDGNISRSGGYGMLADKFTSRLEGYIRAQDFDTNHVKGHSITRQYDGGVNYYFTNLVRLQACYGAQKSPRDGKLGQVLLTQLQAEF